MGDNVAMTTLEIGPDSGTLTLHTGVEGKAARMGHALTIGLTDWSATVTHDGGRPTAVSFRAGLASFAVLEGNGGVKPLSDKDRRTIRDSALESLSAAKHPDVTLDGTEVVARDGGWTVVGTLTVAGAARPVRADVAVTETAGTLALSLAVPVVQSAHGVKPYSAMMGTLKVADVVEVRLRAEVPTP